MLPVRAVKTELTNKFPMNNTSYVNSLSSVFETPFYAIFRDLQLYSTTGYICSTASMAFFWTSLMIRFTGFTSIDGTYRNVVVFIKHSNCN